MEKDKIKFMKSALVFLSILLILILIINSLYIKYIFEEKQIYRKGILFDRFINEHLTNEIDYIFFGDSHTGDGINPLLINNSFNYGLIGETYLTTFYKVVKLSSKRDLTFNKFIFEIDMHSFSQSKRDLFLSGNELYFYSKDMDYDSIKEITDDNIIKLWFQRNFIFIGNGEDLRRLFLPKINTKIILGWTKKDGDFSQNKDKNKIVREVGNFHFKGKNLINEKSFGYFIKTLKVAKEKNISIVLIKYPLSYEYDQMLLKRGINRSEHYKTLFNRIDLEIGKENYKVLDYYNLFFNNSNYFYDPEHLNYIGATIFSKRVNNDLKLLN